MVAAPMHRPSGPDRSGAWKETQVPGGACAARTEQSGGEDEYVAGALIGSQDKKFDPNRRSGPSTAGFPRPAR